MQASEQVKKDLNKVKINPEQWKDIVILMSNSELDGFREGDADLIDKVLFNLHQSGITACRVVASVTGAPVERLKEVETGQLISLSANPLESYDNLQKQLLQIIDSKFKGKQIIFYIGSRGDTVDPKFQRIVGSGSLFDIKLIHQLKARNIKIVVCCLEFKFFKRSAGQLSICYQMLRQQLFFADAIQFLTQHDLSNFIKTMDELRSSPVLKGHRLLKIQSEFNLSADIAAIGGHEGLESLKKRGRFISGIFTVPPLTETDILSSELVGADKDPAKILNRRPLNVLCFGMIRPHKGFEEGIELAKLFESNKTQAKVYIVGGIIESASSCTLMRKLMARAFDITNGQVTILIKNKLIESKDMLDIPADKKAQINEGLKFDNLFKVFIGNKQNLNRFFQLVCVELANKYKEQKGHEPPIIFMLNVTDEELKKIALKCKYAIKLDHKGMANNASTIVSCLGLYLPTFTAAGLLTGNEFRDPGKHRIRPARQSVTGLFGEFGLVVFMPPKVYNIVADEEVQPSNFQVQQIYETIMNDTNYEQRMRQIILLHQSRQFDSIQLTQRIIDELFIPVLKPASGNMAVTSVQPK